MISGIPSSPGIGCGAVFILHEREVPLGRSEPNAPGGGTTGTTPHIRRSEESEMERFFHGREIAEKHYAALVERVKVKIGEDEAEIFEGHLEILTGDDMEEGVREAVMSGQAAAERAVIDFAEATAKEFEELESEYFQQRAGDLRDIGRRLAEAIYFGSITDPGELPENSVVVAVELTPSATARLDTDKVSAIATEKGGRTSHAAILARSLGIPCVTGAEGLLSAVHSGDTVLVDGEAGTVDPDINPEKMEEAKLRIQKNKELESRRREWTAATPSCFSDGSPYGLYANISGANEAQAAERFGIGGVGLFRTEFLFIRFSDFPTVDQQAEEYRGVCKAVGSRPVIVRLLDCGADKPLPYAYHHPEDNPFLGERGIRFLLAREKRLKEQLGAISRVRSEGFDIRAMIPMVVSIHEIEAVRKLLPDGSDLPVGIMVETPAAVLNVESLAARSDFFSIGTNDLVQYLLTVDRGNPRVSDYYQEFHPSVLRAISTVVRGAHKAGIHVGVCGDMASHPDTALALLALGVDEISASVNAVPEIKAAFAEVSGDKLAGLAETLLAAEDAQTARESVQKLLNNGAVPWDND